MVTSYELSHARSWLLGWRAGILCLPVSRAGQPIPPDTPPASAPTEHCLITCSCKGLTLELLALLPFPTQDTSQSAHPTSQRRILVRRVCWGAVGFRRLVERFLLAQLGDQLVQACHLTLAAVHRSLSDNLLLLAEGDLPTTLISGIRVVDYSVPVRVFVLDGLPDPALSPAPVHHTQHSPHSMGVTSMS